MISYTLVSNNVIDGNRTDVVRHGLSSSDPNFAGMVTSSLLLPNFNLFVYDLNSAAVIVSQTSLTVSKGSLVGATYTLVLNSQPTSGGLVIVNMVCSDPTKLMTVPASVGIRSTNWQVAQIITVLGINNYKVDGNTPLTITHTLTSTTDPPYNNLTTNVPSVSVMVLDTDVAVFSTSVTTMSVTKTLDLIPYTVKLSTIPYYPVTVRGR